MEDVKIVINGAGSAGISICKLLLEIGVGDVVLVDRQGAISSRRRMDESCTERNG